MKRNWIAWALLLCLVAAVLFFLGIGPYSGGSAVRDLKGELESLYGEEYTGKTVENGTEDMVFVVEPKTWFLTNWNLRNALGLDYRYECRVIFTHHADDGSETVRTVTYQGLDPMGEEDTAHRAYLDLDRKAESTN